MQSSRKKIEEPEGRAAGPLEVFDAEREWSTMCEKAHRLEDSKEQSRRQGVRLSSRWVENVRKSARRGLTGRFALKRLNEWTKFKEIIKRRAGALENRPGHRAPQLLREFAQQARFPNAISALK